MINKLERHNLNCNLFSAYDYNGLTMNELLCEFFSKINECVDLSNKTLDLSQWLVNEGLSIEVAKQINQWLIDGTLDDIINVEIFKDLNDKITDMSEEVEEKVSKRYKTKYKSVSGSVNPEQYTVTDVELDVCLRDGLDLTLCPMVSITNAQDPNLVNTPQTRIVDVLDRAKIKGVNVCMLKPHIGINFSDTFNRKDYKPNDIPLFFKNWETVLDSYCQLALTYKIPLICLSVEMSELTKDVNVTYWEQLYNNLKTKYSSLLFIHSPKNWEFIDNIKSIKHADLLGATHYTNYVDEIYSNNDVIDVNKVTKGFYTSTESKWNFLEVVFDRCKIYNKKFMFTEIGCMALNDGLIDVVPKSYNNGDRYTNYGVQGALYESLFKNICGNEYIEGFSIWHLREPFDYWKQFETTKAEGVIQKYCKGGIV